MSRRERCRERAAALSTKPVPLSRPFLGEPFSVAVLTQDQRDAFELDLAKAGAEPGSRHYRARFLCACLLDADTGQPAFDAERDAAWIGALPSRDAEPTFQECAAVNRISEEDARKNSETTTDSGSSTS